MFAARLAVLVCVFVSIASTGSAQVNGYLVIQGGGALTNDVKERFVALAGGPRARFVYIPTALSDAQIGDAEKRGAAIAKGFGIAGVTVLHTRDRVRATRRVSLNHCGTLLAY